MDAFVLGAGFSRAVSSVMPQMSDLLPGLVEFVGYHQPKLLRGDRLVVHDLEGFLSLLASRQPFFTDAENAEHAGLFERVAGWLGDQVRQMQRKTLEQPMPDWLARLVTKWHDEQTSVLTLNYDTIVEAAVNSLTLQASGVEGRIRPWDIYSVPIQLARAQGGAMFSTHDPRRSGATFQLLKLHGSVTWHYAGIRTPGPPVDAGGYGTFEDPDGGADPTGQYWSGGLTPMIVPPTFSKSAYLDNATMLRLWLRARHDLESASTVYLIGYSLPAGDVQMASLLASSIGSQVVVVNQDPEVATRVGAVCNAPVDDSHAGFEDCIERFVGSYT